MLKELEISKQTTRRSHRTYTSQFKAQLVAACQQPGTSIAALATQHAMNANVLHRWLKEHQLSGRHQLLEPDGRVISHISPQPPAFIPLTLPIATPPPGEQEVKIELRKAALSVVLTWPLSAAADLASWTAAILK